LRYVNARSDLHYVWILNNDTVVAKDALTAMLSAALRDPYQRPIGSMIYEYERPEKLQMCGGLRVGVGYLVAPTPVRQLDKVAFLSGASLFLARPALQRLGYFPEEYFLNSEDLEYTYFFGRQFRAVHPELAPFLVAGSVWHKVGATQRRDKYLYAHYLTRNMLYSAEKLGRRSLVWTLGYVFVRAFYSLVRGRIERASGILSGVRAYRDGQLGPYRP
jgi:GT2 family glycosyltransferase